MFQEQITTLCCNNIDHKELKIQSICISPNCTLNSRLMCIKCLEKHKLHYNFQESRIEELINLQTTNLMAKQVVQLFQSVKVRVMSLLNDIETQLIEKTKYIKQPSEFDEILNDIINNYEKRQSHYFLNKLIQLKIQEDNSIQKLGFSRIFLQYIEKFNNWMASVPEFRLQDERINILKGQITAYGKPLTYKISNNELLVSSITLFENCYLKGFNFGQIEIIDKLALNKEIRIIILLGQNFNNIVYQESFKVQNSTKDDFNFTKQIILLKSNCYTIVVSANQGTFAIRAQAESGQINPFLKYEKDQRYLNTRETDNIIQALYIADIIIQLIKI